MDLREVQERARKTWTDLQDAIPAHERETFAPLAPYIEILTDPDYAKRQTAHV